MCNVVNSHASSPYTFSSDTMAVELKLSNYAFVLRAIWLNVIIFCQCIIYVVDISSAFGIIENGWNSFDALQFFNFLLFLSFFILELE